VPSQENQFQSEPAAVSRRYTLVGKESLAKAAAAALPELE
jgi:hypothetical protein